MMVILSSLFDSLINRFVTHLPDDSLVAAVKNAWEQWLTEHWLIAFFLHHPWVLGGLVFLILFLISGILRALSRTSENLWLFLLKLPFQVLGWLGIQSISWLKYSQDKPTPINRITELLIRLDYLRDEQEAILQEVKILLKGQAPGPKA